jgi:hypothetical protein
LLDLAGLPLIGFAWQADDVAPRHELGLRRRGRVSIHEQAASPRGAADLVGGALRLVAAAPRLFSLRHCIVGCQLGLSRNETPPLVKLATRGERGWNADRKFEAPLKPGNKAMIQFEYVARNGARLTAHYIIEGGKLRVTYREKTMSVPAGVTEIANAFLRDNLMRSILGEIGPAEQTVSRDPPGLSPAAA